MSSVASGAIELTVGVLAIFISFVVGSLARPWISERWTRYRREKMLNERLHYYAGMATRAWVVSQHADVLPRMNGRTCPFITSDALLIPSRDPDEAGLIQYEPSECAYKVNDGIIRSRARSGTRLVDNPTYRVIDIVEERHRLRTIRLGMCRYSQYVTTLGEIENESMQRRNDRRQLACPNGSSRIAPEALQERAFGLGVMALLAWQQDQDWFVALQQRSTEVFVHPGRHSIVPSFILQPRPNRAGGGPTMAQAREDCNLWHNFLREYFEELIDPEGEAKSGSQVHPRWYESLPDVAALNSWRGKGTLEFWFLGLGFDAFNLEPVMLVAAIIRESDFAHMVHRWQKNWETPHAEIMSLYGPDLNNLFDGQRLLPGAETALMQLRKLIPPTATGVDHK